MLQNIEKALLLPVLQSKVWREKRFDRIFAAVCRQDGGSLAKEKRLSVS